MIYDIYVTKKDDVRYRIKGYTSEDFSLEASSFHKWKTAKLISDLAKQIGEIHFEKDPRTIYGYECNLDLLYRGKVYPFKVTGQPSIDWEVKQGEVIDYIMTEEGV